MKKIAFSLLLSFFAFTAFAQTTERDNTQTNTAARPDFPGTLRVDIGFNFLADAPASMDLNWWGSKGVGIYYLYDIPIGTSRFRFNPGIGLGLEKYKFDGPYTLASSTEGTTVDTLRNVGVKKSKLATNYLDIPLEVKYYFSKNNPSRGLRLTLGAKVGVLYGSHTKVKYEEDGETKKLKQKENYDLNRFRYGATARLGLGGFDLFYYQSLSELFESGKAPGGAAITPFTIGLSIVIF